MDQTRTITEIINEANSNGAKEEKLPNSLDCPPLSKADCAIDNQKQECSKYPYQRVVGQLCHKQRYYLDLAKLRGRIGSIADQQCLYQLSILCN